MAGVVEALNDIHSGVVETTTFLRTSPLSITHSSALLCQMICSMVGQSPLWGKVGNCNSIREKEQLFVTMWLASRRWSLPLRANSICNLYYGSFCLVLCWCDVLRGLDECGCTAV